MLARSTPPGDFRKDARGAVYVEFLIAFMPVLMMFLSLWQISILYTTKIMVDHAASVAARCGAVIVAENPNKINDSGGASTVNQLDKTRQDMIRRAAMIALMPRIIDGTVVGLDLFYPEPAKWNGPDAMKDKNYPPMSNNSVQNFRVRVQATMTCKIAFAGQWMCGGLGCSPGQLIGGFPTMPVTGEAVYPYQGARYTYDPND
jgi:hypothetical protein